MTISSSIRVAGPYTSDGSTVDFPFAFRVFAETDVQVIQSDADGNETDLSGLWSATINDDQDNNPGGTVTLYVAPAVGTFVRIFSAVPSTQSVVLTNQGGMFPAVLNGAFDRAVALIQQEALARSYCMSIPRSVVASTVLPIPGARRFLRWNDTGTAIEASDMAATVTTAADGSRYIVAASAAALRTASGAVPDALWAITQGVLSPGDQGGGTWYWDAASTETDNTGTVLLPDGATGAGRWVRLTEGPWSICWFGAVPGGGECSGAIQAAIDAAVAALVPLTMAPGVYLVGSALTVSLPANDLHGFTLTGPGSNLASLKYTGSGAMSAMLSLVPTSGYSIMSHLSGFEIDLRGAPAGAVGLRINAGMWRGQYRDLYIHRDLVGGVQSGSGILMGSDTVGERGCFDNKFSDIYLLLFDIGLDFRGTDASGNTITNVVVANSYISSCRITLQVSWFNGFISMGTQYENAYEIGVSLIRGYTASFIGGIIESARAGAKGIVLDAYTKSCISFADMLNNPGGHFIGNGLSGHVFKTASSGLIFPAGSEQRIESDGTNVGHLRFFQNGGPDCRVGLDTTGNRLVIRNSSDAIKIKFDFLNGYVGVNAGGWYSINDGTNFAGFYAYNGTPDTFVTALPGSLCLDYTGAEPWLKTYSASASGWVQLSKKGGPYSLTDGTNTAGVYGYSGTPEAHVTANPGSICIDYTGGKPYYKSTGTGNTGWVQLA